MSVQNSTSSSYFRVLEDSEHPETSSQDISTTTITPLQNPSCVNEEIRANRIAIPFASSKEKIFNKSMLLRLVGSITILISAIALIIALAPKKSMSNGNYSSDSQSGKDQYYSVEQENDAIKSLPGWSPLPMPSKQFSGFLDANAEGSLKVHYWFVERETHPESAPIVLWFNGGPGASSLYGILVELGPFLVSDSSLQGDAYEKTGIPQLLYNQYGWQKSCNILALSIPPPIGFSYCLPTGPSATGNDCGPWNDTSTAAVTYHAIKEWLKRFPQYSNNSVWIAGESYAGVYVPEIVKNILADQPDNGINLSGFLVGDACTPPAICGSDRVGPIWNIEFLYGKGAFSNKLYKEIQASCSQQELEHGVSSAQCSSAVNKIDQEAGGYWVYGFYDECFYENDIRRERLRRSLASRPQSRNQLNYYEYYGPPIHTQEHRIALDKAPQSNAQSGIPSERIANYPNGYQCGGPAAQVEWLGKDKVKQALNIPLDAVFFQSDNGVGFTYTFGETDLISWYKKIIAENFLRVIVYNGDTDPCINSLQAQNWTSSLGFNETQSWRPWTLDGCQRMGGYVTRYENGFDFITIRGSGHMVPQFKSRATLEFLSRVLDGTDYQQYNPSCSGPSKQ